MYNRMEMKFTAATLLILLFVTATALACFEFLNNNLNETTDSTPVQESGEVGSKELVEKGGRGADENEPTPTERENRGSDDYYNPILAKGNFDDDDEAEYDDDDDDGNESRPAAVGKLLKERMKAHFKKGVHAMVAHHKVPDHFKAYLNNIAMPHALRANTDCHCGGLLCIVCEIILDILLELLDEVIDLRDIFFFLTQVCIHMKIESKEVCTGTIKLQAVVVLWIANHRPANITGETFCATILQGRNCRAPLPAFNVTIPARDNAAVNNTARKARSTDVKPLKILQMSDAHYDPDYIVGSLALCDHPMCCSAGSGKAKHAKQGAGYWGDFRECDPPRHTLVATFKRVAQQHPDIDMVYFTGDVISHKLWATTRETNARDLRDIFGDMYEHLPNWPCYAILGNHEAHPVNGFAPPQIVDENIENNWLYREVAEIWSKWLPPDTKETILAGGYYTVLAKPGLRIIAMNSNVIYSLNWWVLYETKTIIQQLQWLADTLYQAEQNNEKVHILSHVPSGDSNSYIPWGREFLRIVERFHDTITGIFNGHTHYDEMLLYHDRRTHQPISVAWNGGSLTNYANVNNNYKIYTVDGENFKVLDFETWIFDLTVANRSPGIEPTWYKLYSFKEAYGLRDLSPKSIKKLILRLTTNNTLIQRYHSYKYRRMDWMGRCTDKCKEQHLCRMITQVHGDEDYCEELMEIYDNYYGRKNRFSRKNGRGRKYKIRNNYKNLEKYLDL